MEQIIDDAGHAGRSLLLAAAALALVWLPRLVYIVYPARYTLYFLFPIYSMAYLGPALYLASRALEHGGQVLQETLPGPECRRVRLLARLGRWLAVLAIIFAMLTFFCVFAPEEDFQRYGSMLPMVETWISV